MTERENVLMVIRGEQPEWVPNYRDSIDQVIPYFFMEHLFTPGSVDFFSVPWTLNDNGPMPIVNSYVMDDATRWREYVHLPDLDSLDWEEISKKDLAIHDPNKAIGFMASPGPGNFYLHLLDMMGVENGLCAFLEEPEAIHEFFEYLCDYEVKLIDIGAKYYHPDFITLNDDVSSAKAPFISMEIWNEFLHPVFKRLIDRAKEYELPVEFHMCGKGECIIEDLVSMGVSIWQPAQPLNDLKRLKEKYGNRLVFNGTWYTASAGGVPGAPEEVVRQSVRDAMDKYAVGGGLIFWDGDPVGTSEDTRQKMAWLHDEAVKYGREFYKKNT